MTTIKITCTTNAYASQPIKLEREIGIGRCKHNGGKVIILTVDSDDVTEATIRLDAIAQVASFEVRS